MPAKRENYDQFAVPRNFGEDGISFNGISRRNLVEGAILAFGSGYPIFHLSVPVSVRIILMCFISLPLFFLGLVGLGGQSISEFFASVIKWLFTRRKLRYYIDTGEEEPPKLTGIARIKSLFQKKNWDAIQYIKVRKVDVSKLGGLFDWIFVAKKKQSYQGQDSEESAPKSRQTKNMAQTFFPVEDIRGGMIVTKDKRFVKVVEIHPINFLLRSADEQRDIILSFAELLRIAPVNMQFKSNANRADISKFLARTVDEIEQEQNQKCREMGQDYIEHIQNIATNNAISRRFFVIFEYDNPIPAYKPSEADIQFTLESIVRNFRSYMSRCGNSIVEFERENEENEFLLSLLFMLQDHYNTEGISLDDKVERAFKLRLKGGNTNEMCTADYACPGEIDFTHSKYVVIDGVYHAYLHIPSTGFKTLVGAAWLSPLINAGEAIDVDLFLRKLPSDRMQVQVSRNLRLNKAKISDVSNTSADYNRMGDIMESGFYLQRGLNDGQEFFYMNVLVTVKAFSKKDLDNRVNEVVKMMTAKQITLKHCAYMQEAAYLSTLPLAKLDQKLHKLGRRNILTNTAASTYMFTSFEICDDKGILIGTNEHNNSLVILDNYNLKKYKAPHICLMGCTGSGKSFTLQTIASRLRRKHVKTYVICPTKGHEFRRKAEAIGGAFIRMSPGSQHCINIMEIPKPDNSVSELLDGEVEEQSYLSLHIDFLLITFSLMHKEITYMEEQILDEALMKTYAEFGITNDNDSLIDPNNPDDFKTMPILGNLYHNLRANPLMEKMRIALTRYVSGSACHMFNGQTNVDTSNPYTVFDLTYLKNKTMLTVGMFVTFYLVWSRCQQNRLEQNALIIDELWQLIGAHSNSLAAEYVVEIAKIARAYNTAAIFPHRTSVTFSAWRMESTGKQ